MNKILPLTLTLLASSYVATAKSDDAWYLGALYNAQDISTHGRDFKALGITAGYQFNDYFSVESRFSKGTSGYSTSYDTPEKSNRRYEEDIDSQAAILVKGSYPVIDNLEIYALVGYTNTKIEVNGLGQYNDGDGNITGDYQYKTTYTENGLSYGMGLLYRIDSKFNVFLDYQVLPDFEPTSNYSVGWKSTTLGMNYSF